MATLVIKFSELLANDVGDGLTVLSIGEPTQGGQAVLDLDGRTITYTPPAVGQNDSFTYKIQDKLGQTSVATIFISISGQVVVPPVEGAIRAVDDHLTLNAFVAKQVYFARGSILMSANSALSLIGIGAGESTVLFGQTFSATANSKMTLFLRGVNLNATFQALGITAAVARNTGFVLTDPDASGYFTIYRDAPFSQSEIAALPAKLFGTVTTGSKYIPDGTTDGVARIPVSQLLANDQGANIRLSGLGEIDPARVEFLDETTPDLLQIRYGVYFQDFSFPYSISNES
ncbi:MAG: hypothetical protein EOP83_27225, partial [Verrucomicrobiaceae bacterium]